MKIYNIINIPKGLSPEVECECREEYLSGYTAGYEDGKNKGFQSGYTSGVTDGIEEGKEEQKSLMVYTAITENGTYSREDGYNEIFVDVPTYSGGSYESGYTDGYASGYTDGSEDGFQSGYTSGYTDGTEDGFGSGFTSGYTEGYSSGYTDGLNASGHSYESGYTSGYTDGYSSGYTQGTEDGYGSGYTSGYTDGSEDGYGSGYTSGKTDGVAEQKAKLVATAVTSNGTYSRENGFSSVSVNIPQTGHTDEEIAEAFSSGKTAGVDEQKAKLVATAFTANGTFSRPDGFSSVYVNVPQTGQTINNQTKNVNISQNGSSTVTHDSNYTGLEYVTINVNVPQTGHTDQEMAEAYASGITHQKSLLATTAFTGNGTFTRTDGWSTVVVNVPVSGYTQEDLDNAFNSGWTNGYNSGWTDGWNASGDKNVPLTVNVLSAGTILWVADVNQGEYSARTIEYQKNDGEWTSIIATTAGAPINVAAGDVVKFRGNNPRYAIYFNNIGNHLLMQTGKYQLAGNIMSLIDSTNYASITGFTNDNLYAFVGFFGGGLGVVDASHMVLPANTLTKGCYAGMFSGCTNLKAVPKLPATTLAQGCYKEMFKGCSGLTTAPELPAQTLAKDCYANMFADCASLTTAPELPATTLAQNCYTRMFSSCTSLTSAPALPATTLAQNCYTRMFSSCISLTSAPELPATTLAQSCYEAMFEGCTSLTTAPALPATALTEGCYQYMFNSCTSLTSAPELPAPILPDNCYQYMFYYCRNLNYIKCLAISNIGTSSSNWVSGVASTGTFVKDPNATWYYGPAQVPNNWTIVDAS